MIRQTWMPLRSEDSPKEIGHGSRWLLYTLVTMSDAIL